jgi:hypothetical protein
MALPSFSALCVQLFGFDRAALERVVWLVFQRTLTRMFFQTKGYLFNLNRSLFSIMFLVLAAFVVDESL